MGRLTKVGFPIFFADAAKKRAILDRRLSAKEKWTIRGLCN